jgi:uncharacterized RDD family membrane protein YckC
MSNPPPTPCSNHRRVTGVTVGMRPRVPRTVLDGPKERSLTLSFRDAAVPKAGRILGVFHAGPTFRDKTMECPHCHQQTSARSQRCRSCGEVIPPAQYLLEESGVIVPGATPRPTIAARAAVRTPASHRPARLGDRFVAFVLDTIFLFGLLATVDSWVFMRWGTVTGAELDLTTASLLIAGILNAGVLFAYGWLLEASVGATLGKAIVGIRVVQAGRRTTLAASAIRNGLRIVDGLGFYLVGAISAGCSRLHQRLGDICAGTLVVEAEFGVGIKILTLLLWAGMLAGAGWAVPRICSKNNAVQHPGYLNQVVVQVGGTDSSAYIRVARFRIDLQLATSGAPVAGM